MNIQRLQHLITILQGVPPDRFNLAAWKCGTTACAVGWACLAPEFNKQGLTFRGPGPVYSKPDAEPDEFYTHWRAVEEFFGLTEVQAWHLFTEHAYASIPNPVPQDVADRITALLKGSPQ